MTRSVIVAGIAVVVLITGVGAYAVLRPFLIADSQPAGAVAASPLILEIEANYPGANASVVAETIAAPIEQQLRGLEKLTWMTSESRNDGSYVLQAAFENGVDANEVRMLTQNRVNQATPLLPDDVQRAGVTIRQQTPLALLLTVTSPDGKHDANFLWNYASKLRIELLRIPGIGDVSRVAGGPQVRVRLDPEKLAAMNLTATDVMQALQKQDVAVQAGLVLAMPRMGDPEKVADTIVMTTANGHVIRLRDVAQVTAGTEQPGVDARWDGKPVALLGMHAMPWITPAKLATGVSERLRALVKDMPAGVVADVAIDLAASDHLTLEVALPAGSSRAWTSETLTRCATALREGPGVQGVLTITGAPFTSYPSQGLILLRTKPAANRAALAERCAALIRDGQIRPRPAVGFPVVLAVHGPAADQRQRFAEVLAARLRKTPSVQNPWIDPAAAAVPTMTMNIDRDKAKTLGIAMHDLFDTLAIFQAAPGTDDKQQLDDLRAAKIRSAKGEMVPVSSVVTLRMETTPASIKRRDGQPVLEITANLAPGAKLDDVRAQCEKLAATVRKELGLSAEYGVKWIGR